MRTIYTRLALALMMAALAPAPALVAQDTQPPTTVTTTRYTRPVVRFALDYALPAGHTVREVRVVFGDVTIAGHVEREVMVFFGSARVASTGVIGGSLGVFGGSATIEPGATIGHDLVVAGGTLTAPPDFSAGGNHVIGGSPWMASALGEITPWITRGLLWGRLIVPGIPWVWTAVVIFFLLYLVVNIVFDRAVAATATAIDARPLSMFMAGMLVLLLLVPLLAIVAASVIGLLIIPFILCAIVAAGIIGKVAVARAIGASVLRPRAEAEEGRARGSLAFVIGFALLTLAYMVPVLGFVTWALTSVLGFGAAAMTMRGMLRRERPAPPVAPPAPVVAPASVTAAAAMPVPAASAVVSSAPQAAALPVDQPSPAFTQGLAQYPRATFLDRVAAFALDCVLVAIAGTILDMERYEELYLFALLAYHVAFWAWKGTTLGGIICSLRVIRTHGAELRGGDAVVRGLASVFSLAALGIGCLWMLQDRESQMWHDKIAGTLVVKVPRDLVMP